MAEMKIGILGGTFDPPHIGHMILADEARHQLKLDRVLWVLTPDPPHKRGKEITPLADRLAMLQAVLSSDPVFWLSTVDVDRPPPHYALDTMLLLRRRHPEAELVYLMGSDSLRDLPNWHKPLDFLAACDAVGVMRRAFENFDLAALRSRLPGIQDKVQWIVAPLLEISATNIRASVRSGGAWQYYVNASVRQIIRERGLYLARE